MLKNEKKDIFDTLAILLLCIGMLFYVNNRIIPKSLYLFGLSAFLMIPSVLSNLNSGINKKAIGFILFFLYLVFCLLFSYSGESFGYVIYYFFGIIYLLYFSKKRNSIEKLLDYYYKGALIFTFFTILSFLSTSIYLKIIDIMYGGTGVYSIITDLFSWHEYSGIAGQTGYNAFTISIGIIISFVKMIDNYKSNNKYNKKLLLCLLVQIFALFLCSKRAIILYAFTTIVFLIPACINIKKKSNFSKLFLVLLIVLFIGSLSINYFEPFGNVFAKNAYYLSKGNLLNGRLPLYGQAIEIFKNNFFFGIGIKRFCLLNELNLDVHNVYLQLLAENGLIGFLIMIFSFIYMFFKTKSSLKHSTNGTVVYISLGIQLFFLLYALTGNTLYDVNMLYLYFAVGSINVYLKGGKYEQ